MCLSDGKKFLKMQMSHEMNAKGMESSIPLKLSTPVGCHCNNCQVDFMALQQSGRLLTSLVARVWLINWGET